MEARTAGALAQFQIHDKEEYCKAEMHDYV
jgi:hypothetical protein